MNNYVLLRHEYNTIKREKKSLILILFFICITIFSIMITHYIPEIMKILFIDQIKEMESTLNKYIENVSAIHYINQFSKYISQLGFIITSIIFSNFISDDLREKRIYLLLALGIKRKDYFVSKSLIINLLSLICLVLSLVVFRAGLFIYHVTISFNLYFTMCNVLLLKYLILINIIPFISSFRLNSWGILFITLLFYAALSAFRYMPYLKMLNPFYYIYVFSINSNFKNYILAIVSTIAVVCVLNFEGIKRIKKIDL
ncbi:MAG: hypothetical protein PUG67_07305 [Peptoniphilaceae bacterium]|nr:hypothetical protein [Peptoniphilaceae bacterium]